MLKIRPLMIPEFLLAPVWDARPPLRQRVVQESAGSCGLALSLAHPVYTMTLDPEDDEAKLPEEPTSLRVLDAQDGRTQTSFDVTLGDHPRLKSIAGGGSPYRDLLRRALEQAADMIAPAQYEAELRLLNVPALFMEALWLRVLDDTGEEDLFVPMRSPFGPEAFQVYEQSEFLTELSARVRSQQSEQETVRL